MKRQPQPPAEFRADLAQAIIASATDYAIFTMDLEGSITAWSPGAERIFGYAAREALSMNFDRLFVDADRIAGKPRSELDGAVQNGRAEDTRWHLRKTGEVFWASGVTMRIRAQPLLVKVVRDETRIKLAEDQRVLLLAELTHRIKNTLTTAQSIATQTLRDARVPADLRETLTARMTALAETHNILFDRNWAGADLASIVARAVSPHESSPGERFDVEGPTVLLSPQQAVSMSLVLHELATNALKYGALSANDGRVAITWNLSYDERSARVLTLLWRERGGPPVLPPIREGFGTRLLTRSFAQFGGSAAVHYEPEGLSCLLEFSLSAAEEIPGPDTRYVSPPAAARPAPPAAAARPGRKHPPQGRPS